MIVSSALEIPLPSSASALLSLIYAFFLCAMLRTRFGDPLYKFGEPFPCVGMKLNLVVLYVFRGICHAHTYPRSYSARIILQRIGKIASEWAWVEMLLGEMLAHFCHADPGSMYVITHNVSVATQTDWLRTLAEIQVKDETTKKVILDLLNEVDGARTERNTIVHGVWRAHSEAGFGFVQTFRWDRQEVVRDELWSHR
jgi:hypothetical protein